MRLTFREWVLVISSLKTAPCHPDDRQEVRSLEAKLMAEMRRQCPEEEEAVT